MKIVSLPPDEFLEKLTNFASAKALPDADDLVSLCRSASLVLDSEDSSYRPFMDSAEGVPGGLLDFTAKPAQPLIIVPDVHARSYFIKNILTYSLPEEFVANAESGCTVLQALENRAVRIVFVGDYLHSESRARERWFSAMEDFENNNFTGSAITDEMTEGLSCLMILWALKSRYHENVHLLKGNHENILNNVGGGNFPFKKFANEGEMVRFFVQSVYGDKVLECIASFENLLPVAAAFPSCFISHSEPRRSFTRYELINSPCLEDVTYGLTWTPNGEAKVGGVQKMLSELVPSKDAVYFGGHRSVDNNYALRQDGKFIQIHNPSRQNITLVYTDHDFDAEKDIHSVEPEQCGNEPEQKA